MGKVLIQVGASEEARAAVKAGADTSRLVLPRSNVPVDEEALAAEAAAKAEAEAEAAAKAEADAAAAAAAAAAAPKVTEEGAAAPAEASSVAAPKAAPAPPAPKPEVGRPSKTLLLACHASRLRCPVHLLLTCNYNVYLISADSHECPQHYRGCGVADVSSTAGSKGCTTVLLTCGGLRARLRAGGGREHRAGAGDADKGRVRAARRPHLPHHGRPGRLRPGARGVAGRARRA